MIEEGKKGKEIQFLLFRVASLLAQEQNCSKQCPLTSIPHSILAPAHDTPQNRQRETLGIKVFIQQSYLTSNKRTEGNNSPQRSGAVSTFDSRKYGLLINQLQLQALLVTQRSQLGFFLRITKPSRMGVTGRNSSVANSARSPWANNTGVVCVWNPVMVLGLPAWPTTSTAYGMKKLR